MPEVQTLVTVATYNEIDNLPPLVDAIFRQVPEVDILVIDDNSPDGTGQWCDRRAAEDPRVHCLHREGKLGLGTATIAGMRHGIEHGYRYVLNMDADFSHHPRYLPDLISGMEPAAGPPVDVMIGSRYVPGGGVEGWPLRRRLMSRGVNLYAAMPVGVDAPRLQRGVSVLPDRGPRSARFRRDPQPRLLVPGGNPLALEARGVAIRRDAHRLRRPDARHLKDQHPRSPGGNRHHLRVWALGAWLAAADTRISQSTRIRRLLCRPPFQSRTCPPFLARSCRQH